MMQFMREHRKGLLIVFVVIFGVCFGLPSFMGNNNQQRNEQIATFNGIDGVKSDIMSSDITAAGLKLKAMLELQVPVILIQYGMYEPSLAMINPIAVLLTSNAIFTDNSIAMMTKGQLRESANAVANDTQQLKDIYNKVAKLVDTNRQSVENYIVLANEANNNGYHATQEQITLVVTAAQQTVNQRNIRLADILSGYGLTRGGFEEAVGELIAIALYADEITKVGALNENEVREKVRDSVEVNNLSGKYVDFSSYMFMDEVGEPDEDEIIAHFDKYKDVDLAMLKRNDQENPFAFSYMLPNRLKVEFLDISVQDIVVAMTNEFDAKPVIEQEELLQKYWATNKSQQQYQTRIPATDPQAQPTYKQKTFDEAYTTLKRNYINELARAKADTVMANVRDAVRNENELVEANTEWQKVAQLNSSDDIIVNYGVSDYLSYETINQFERFSSAKAVRMNNATLAQVLFNSEPLAEVAVSKSDLQPLKLRQTLPFIEAGYGTNISNLYVVRIIGVDKARVPVSIEDDGRQGPADAQPISDELNPLRDKVVNDLKELKRFSLAVDKANEFKALAKDGWQQAIETVGNSLKDPDDENAVNPIAEKDLATLYSQIDNARKRMQEQPEYQQTFQGVLNNYYQVLESVLKEYRKAGSGVLLLDKLEAEGTVRVFDELIVQPANQDDLANNKARFIIQSLQRNQFLPLMEFFMQDNIDKRNAVQFVNKPQDQPTQDIE